MRLLLDTCISAKAADHLRQGGHDVIHAADWDRDPGDEAILASALADERILITLDKDFGDLAILEGQRHHGILRIVDFPSSRQGEVCMAALAACGDELLAGAIATAQPGRLRIRPADPDANDGSA